MWYNSAIYTDIEQKFGRVVAEIVCTVHILCTNKLHNFWFKKKKAINYSESTHDPHDFNKTFRF